MGKNNISQKINVEDKKQELIWVLQKLYKERNNKRPRTIDAQNNIGGPNYTTYVKYFGSWEKALQEAGVDKDEYKDEY